ncbi:MFS transporter [Microbacterium betulae]|uniref:MFS transporter n=1 Tax=Microbacterium betulae TaxID=2981139 RepID=A0AA97I4R9_9MICO|nr:MFS transporter [Microbacterium sp. AB]WOF22049.1 MFS transporter [Microbacterium sp. AB]
MASRVLLDTRPLTQHPAFARLWVGSTLGGLGGQLTITAVMLHMYHLTGSTFAVAMIAVAGLLPMIVAGLYGGMLADFFDRRLVALIAATVTWLSTALLAVLAWTGHVGAWWLYGLSIVNSAANSIVSATKMAITPRLVGAALIPAAAALNGITVGVMVMVGPALGGVLVALFGYPVTYTLDLVLMLSLFLGLWTLPRLRPEGETARPGLASLVDGTRFLMRAPNIRTQFLLDIVAMTFGNPLALFPAIGAVLLGGGEVTTGLLVAAGAVGAFGSSLFSGRVSAYRRHGLGIARAVQAFGVVTAVFGLVLAAGAVGWLGSDAAGPGSPSIPLIAVAMICLALAGAADNVSSIYRQTMLQSAVPDAVRGRLQGVFIVVVTGGPRLGALYAGTLATVSADWFGGVPSTWLPPLLGGVLVVLVATLVLRASPSFLAYDAESPAP